MDNNQINNVSDDDRESATNAMQELDRLHSCFVLHHNPDTIVAYNSVMQFLTNIQNA